MTQLQSVGAAMASRFYFYFLIILSALFAQSAVAIDARTYLDKLGGPGGSQFDEPCPDDTNLHGFELRVGDDVDAIRAVCVQAYAPTEISAPQLTQGSGLQPIFPGNTLMKQQEVTAGWHGGAGGARRVLLCPKEAPIVLGMTVVIEGVDTLIIDSIYLYCGQAIANQAVPKLPSAQMEGRSYVASDGWLGVGVGGDSGHKYRKEQSCASGQVAIGMHGASGVWLDSLGLICGGVNISTRPEPPKPAMALGRVSNASDAASGPVSLCERARAAKERGSPAAASLEAQCRASGGSMPAAAGAVALGRVTSQPTEAPDLCESAAAARARNSPSAPGLEAQCARLNNDEYAARGPAIANADPRFAALRAMQEKGEVLRGFDIGMTIVKGNTEWGPGKQKVRDSLSAPEITGFDAAVLFAMARNKNAVLAEIGASIAENDLDLFSARNANADPRYALGFDIATGIFGDPENGGQGNSVAGPGALGIRGSLYVLGKKGFDSSMNLHLNRKLN